MHKYILDYYHQKFKTPPTTQQIPTYIKAPDKDTSLSKLKKKKNDGNLNKHGGKSKTHNFKRKPTTITPTCPIKVCN